MKRFFSKKSVALFFTTIILVGFFSINIASALVDGDTRADLAAANVTVPQGEPVIFKAGAANYYYQGGGLWHVMPIGSGGDSVPTVFLQDTYGMTQDVLDSAIKYDNNIASAKTSSGEPIPVKKTGWAKFFDILENTGTYAGDIVFTSISGVIEFITIPLASFALAIAGNILDFSIQYTIYGDGFRAMTASVDGVWVLLRDTANVFFIFVLLYAAIQQIITSAPAKKVLVSVIISAFLINFSLFFTKIVIDASNLIATSIYGQITRVTNVSGNASKQLLSDGSSGPSNKSIDLSGRIMDGLNLTTIYDVGPQSSNTKSIVGIGGLINSFTRLVLYLVTFFVFIMLAALLVGRFIMLVILMATSPIGFVGDVVPGMGDYAKDWRSALLKQCLIAPLFMLLMLLTIRLSQTLATQTSTNPTIVFFNFFLVVYLLLKSAKVTKDLSGPVGDFAGRIASTATGLAVGAATGGTSLALRQVAGRGANALAESKYGQRLNTMAASENIVSSVIGKSALAATKRAATGTFDFRNTGVMKETLAQAEGITGMKGMVDADYLKAGGEYGKGKDKKTGFAGMIEKDKAEAIKQGESYEKAAKNYKNTIVDEQIIERLKQKEITIESRKEAEKDPVKKAKLDIQLETIRNERQELAKNSEKALEKVQGVDLSAAATKVMKFEERQREIREREKQLFNSPAEGEEQQKAINKEMEDLDKELKELDKDYQKALGEYDVADALEASKKELEKEGNIFEKILKTATLGGIGNESKLETIKKSKDIRANYAKQIRTRIIGKVLGLHTVAEDAGTSRAVEKGEEKKPVSTEDLAKTLKDMQDKIDEQNKK